MAKKLLELEKLEKEKNQDAIKAKKEEIETLNEDIDSIKAEAEADAKDALRQIFEKYILKTVEDVTNYVEKDRAKPFVQADVKEIYEEVDAKMSTWDIDKVKEGEMTSLELAAYNKTLEAMLTTMIGLVEV